MEPTVTRHKVTGYSTFFVVKGPEPYGNWDHRVFYRKFAYGYHPLSQSDLVEKGFLIAVWDMYICADRLLPPFYWFYVAFMSWYSSTSRFILFHAILLAPAFSSIPLTTMSPMTSPMAFLTAISMTHRLGTLKDRHSNFDRIYTAENDIHINIILEEISYEGKLTEPYEHQWYGFSTVSTLRQSVEGVDRQ